MNNLINKKFKDPKVTADGIDRAFVEAEKIKTLWFNTGTLCNIECKNCYIESSPKNDRLVYLTFDEVKNLEMSIEKKQLIILNQYLTIIRKISLEHYWSKIISIA